MAKGPDAFRTISEAAEEVGVAPHVLRFWESRLSVIRPMKRAGGRRFYRPQDIKLLRALKVLLHEQDRSIREVQALSRGAGVRGLLALAGPASGGEGPPGAAHAEADAPRVVSASVSPPAEGLDRLLAAREDLLAIKRRLDALLSS
ncbi:MerR family transcriptional regulator [Phenylobacterium sp.]|uniref:MerR family transcriptional regulator n=1 Tax=Phenylobacterium sp. TaxID=1871053 RepID=UPI0026008911|nr:MerR family transcriptional regulator [Phenylobacterium sp.]MCA3722203.1 MerR family transcriptional regulator [Phenylobacterium sp.]